MRYCALFLLCLLTLCFAPSFTQCTFAVDNAARSEPAEHFRSLNAKLAQHFCPSFKTPFPKKPIRSSLRPAEIFYWYQTIKPGQQNKWALSLFITNAKLKKHGKSLTISGEPNRLPYDIIPFLTELRKLEFVGSKLDVDLRKVRVFRLRDFVVDGGDYLPKIKRNIVKPFVPTRPAKNVYTFAWRHDPQHRTDLAVEMFKANAVHKYHGSGMTIECNVDTLQFWYTILPYLTEVREIIVYPVFSELQVNTTPRVDLSNLQVWDPMRVTLDVSRLDHVLLPSVHFGDLIIMSHDVERHLDYSYRVLPNPYVITQHDLEAPIRHHAGFKSRY